MSSQNSTRGRITPKMTGFFPLTLLVLAYVCVCCCEAHNRRQLVDTLQDTEILDSGRTEGNSWQLDAPSSYTSYSTHTLHDQPLQPQIPPSSPYHHSYQHIPMNSFHEHAANTWLKNGPPHHNSFQSPVYPHMFFPAASYYQRPAAVTKKPSKLSAFKKVITAPQVIIPLGLLTLMFLFPSVVRQEVEPIRQAVNSRRSGVNIIPSGEKMQQLIENLLRRRRDPQQIQSAVNGLARTGSTSSLLQTITTQPAISRDEEILEQGGNEAIRRAITDQNTPNQTPLSSTHMDAQVTTQQTADNMDERQT